MQTSILYNFSLHMVKKPYVSTKKNYLLNLYRLRKRPSFRFPVWIS